MSQPPNATPPSPRRSGHTAREAVASQGSASICAEFQRTNPEGWRNWSLPSSKGAVGERENLPARSWGDFRAGAFGHQSDMVMVFHEEPGRRAPTGTGLIRAALKPARRLLALEPSPSTSAGERISRPEQAFPGGPCPSDSLTLVEGGTSGPAFRGPSWTLARSRTPLWGDTWRDAGPFWGLGSRGGGRTLLGSQGTCWGLREQRPAPSAKTRWKSRLFLRNRGAVRARS